MVGPVRAVASVLHLDLDAFFAAVEQRDKPSLRGKPVVVGGVGGRGVVSTASYEARTYGVRSAMSTREARSRCPHAAYLSGRFHAYRATSRGGDGAAARGLAAGGAALARRGVRRPRRRRPARPGGRHGARGRRAAADAGHEVTGGLTASVGIGTSKFIAKVASDLDKPDGLVVVAPGSEQDLLRPMHVTVIPGVGPATAERLRRAGIHTVAELESVTRDELVRLLGKAHGAGLYAARPRRRRPAVVAERETKSVSVEGTYDTDLTDRRLMEGLLDPAGGPGRRAAAQARPVGPHRHHQGPAPRLHDPQPVDHAARPRPTTRRRSPGWPGAAGRARHLRRRTPARRRRLRAGRLDPGGPVRRRPSDEEAGAEPDEAEVPEPPPRRGLGARHGRRPRRARPRLGLGLGEGRGDGPVRDGRDRRPGPVRSLCRPTTRRCGRGADGASRPTTLRGSASERTLGGEGQPAPGPAGQQAWTVARERGEGLFDGMSIKSPSVDR